MYHLPKETFEDVLAAHSSGSHTRSHGQVNALQGLTSHRSERCARYLIPRFVDFLNVGPYLGEPSLSDHLSSDIFRRHGHMLY